METLRKLVVVLAMLVGGFTGANAATLADVAIINRTTGERLPIWRHEGRLYVAGRPGDRYAVEIRNRGIGRLLAVLSVDGVNAISGETAGTYQSGYILGSWQRTEVAGWRKSLDEVAAFYFTALPDSYAARTHRPDNVGVIGVALFRELAEPPILRDRAAGAQERESSLGAATAAAPVARLGTGHGERVPSASQYAEFRRASDHPVEVLTVYYDSYANLLAQGIIPSQRPPRPFPGGFVPDPQG